MMIEETDSYFDGLDRTYIDISSKLAEPFCWAYGMLRYRFISPLDPNKFDNTSSRVQEIATRVLIFVSAALAFSCAITHISLAAIAMGTGALLFRAAGFAVQKNQFTHVKGTAPEKTLANGQASVMVWGLCGDRGGLSYRKGGVVHWRSRLDSIVEKIEKEDPDVIVLQEVKDAALAEAIISKLKDRYAHFFTHLGGGACKEVNGCMVITKCAVDDFAHRDLPHEGSYELFTLKAHPNDAQPCIRFIATPLIAGKEQEAKRMDQVAHIVRDLARETLVLPTLFVAANADRDSATEGAFLSTYFHHSYRAPEPTRTDQLALQWDANFKEMGETFETISLVKRTLADGTTLPVSERKIRMIDCHVVEAFDRLTYNTRTALSNRNGIVTEFSL
jgi:hypothetical protein